MALAPRSRSSRGDVVVYPRGDPYFLAPDPGAAPPGAGDAAAMRQLLAGVADGSIPANFSHGPADAARTTLHLRLSGLRCAPVQSADPGAPADARRAAGERASRTPGRPGLRRGRGGRLGLGPRAIERVDVHRDGSLASRRRSACPGWLDGLGDPVVGRALSLIHADPTEPWTTAALAHAAGASRSTLADRFTRLVGQPPMHYLAAWRMRLAADRLADPSATVAEAAHEAGYDSEAAFSRAFKRATGITPGAWRNGRVGDSAGASSPAARPT